MKDHKNRNISDPPFRKISSVSGRMHALGCNAAILLLCAMAAMQPAQALEPGANDTAGTSVPAGPGNGTLNFVDADIESVIAAIGDYTNITFIIDPRVKGKINQAMAFGLPVVATPMAAEGMGLGNGDELLVANIQK
mgnify:CR=1 FL=1